MPVLFSNIVMDEFHMVSPNTEKQAYVFCCGLDPEILILICFLLRREDV